jgi:tight adherence protein B
MVAVNAAQSVRAAVVRRLDDADLPWPSERIWMRAVSALAAVEILAFVGGGWAIVVITAVALAIGVCLAVATLRGRAALTVDRALPEVLEATARSLRSGTSLRIALSEAITNAPDRLRMSLGAVVVASERGVPLVEAVDAWTATMPGEGVRLAGAALALSAELGGSAARSLDGVAATLRDRNAVRREVRALSSQARASALVIGIAPVAFAFLASAVDPETLDFLVHSRAGTTCLFVGVVLDGLGAMWMHRLAAVR